MSDRAGSVTLAFGVIFVILAARHQWLQSFIAWLQKSGPANSGAGTPSQTGETPSGPNPVSVPGENTPGSPIRTGGQ